MAKDHTSNECVKNRLAIQDTLDVVGGKWRLILIAELQGSPMQFNEITRSLGISPRVLSKELNALEINGLVERRVKGARNSTVEYSLSPYSESLTSLINEIYKFGALHRDHIINEIRSKAS